MRLSIKVISRAKQNKVIPMGKDRYQVKVVAPPIQGKANQAVIELLAKYFKVKKSQVEIIRGETTRHKRIYIHDL